MGIKFALILEDDAKFQAEMTDALKSLDPTIVVRIFSRLEGFASWVKILMVKGPAALERAGFALTLEDKNTLVGASEVHLQVLLLKQEFLGGRNLGLIKGIGQIKPI